ncbi:hypothetical protein [Hymenobacter sp.]|uniref:hypothetical protein n=1 Tax=Hymenobacter sp. TaxID=1898978 RepID=UPI00286B3F38|nr:hypothetical protein [Hymenobacter sp.]
MLKPLLLGGVQVIGPRCQWLEAEDSPGAWAAGYFLTLFLEIMPTKKASSSAKKDPCWKGYEQAGTKKKD